jgi:hypothetical protein
MKNLENIQHSLKVKKSQYNNFGGFYYRSCEDILDALKPLLGMYKCGLTLTDNMVNLGNRYYIEATATFTDGDKSVSCKGYAREAESKKGMDEAQVTGACSSYARKYALCGLFLIDDGKDADSENKEGKGQSKPDAESKKMVTKDGVISEFKKVGSYFVATLDNQKYGTESEKVGGILKRCFETKQKVKIEYYFHTEMFRNIITEVLEVSNEQ